MRQDIPTDAQARIAEFEAAQQAAERERAVETTRRPRREERELQAFLGGNIRNKTTEDILKLAEANGYRVEQGSGSHPWSIVATVNGQEYRCVVPGHTGPLSIGVLKTVQKFLKNPAESVEYRRGG